MFDDPLLIGTLGDHLNKSAFIAILAAIVVLRFRRYRAVGGAVVSAVGSAATVAIAVVVSLFALVALGYWDPPVSQIIGDVLGAGRALYDLVGEWVVEQTLGRLDDLAE